jgi:hypothetical protein
VLRRDRKWRLSSPSSSPADGWVCRRRLTCSISCQAWLVEPGPNTPNSLPPAGSPNIPRGGFVKRLPCVEQRSRRRRSDFQPFGHSQVQLSFTRQWRDVYDDRRARTADADEGVVFAEQSGSDREHYGYRVRALRVIARWQNEAGVDAVQERCQPRVDDLHRLHL